MTRYRFRLTLLPLVSVLWLSASAAFAQRLPREALPTHYDLHVTVHMQTGTFDGHAGIDVRLPRATRRVTLHALDMTIDGASATTSDGHSRPATIHWQPGRQSITLKWATALPEGSATLHLRYHAPLNRDLRGLYLSEAHGRRYAVTQLESTDARRAFPCFDEPALKATFSVSATVATGDTAISNGALVADTPGPRADQHTLRFATTARMSTYLVALAVGDFTCRNGSAEGIPLRVCATPQQTALTAPALDAAERILGYYHRYFAQPYPFGKLDMVAIPDFAAGAMENTGAIFYRETDLLLNGDTASVAQTKRVWGVVAHEMAHQWFGDLVTMQWWNDLWLNEGFATWMETRPLAALHPEWQMDLDEVSSAHYAMGVDAVATTRAIRTTLETPDEIEAAFDGIAYEKSAAVLRMVEHAVGGDAFRAGVNTYLTAHAYGNATAEDFWTALAAAAHQPVDRMLQSFIAQPGVPLLTVDDRCTADGTVPVTQSRVSLTPTRADGPTSPVWTLPLCVSTSDGAVRCQMVDRRDAQVPCDAGEPPFVNAGGHGYYRTVYGPQTLAALTTRRATPLTSAEQLSLLGDSWALIRMGRVASTDYLAVARGLARDASPALLAELATQLAAMDRRLVEAQVRPAFQSFVRDTFAPSIADVGLTALPDEDADRRDARAALLRLVGGTGADDATRAAARHQLDAYLSGSTTVDPTHLDALLAVALPVGDLTLWRSVYGRFARANTPGDRDRWLFALTRFTEPALVDRSLQLLLGADIRSQDTSRYLSRFFDAPATQAQAWHFLTAHWSRLAPAFAVSGADTGLAASLSGFCDPTDTGRLRAFFAAHPLPAARRALAATFEAVDACAAERRREQPRLAAWARARSNEVSSR